MDRNSCRSFLPDVDSGPPVSFQKGKHDMKADIRVFGELIGLDDTSIGIELPFDSVRHEDDKLVFEHEGLLFEEIEDTLKRMQKALGPHGSGWVDIIDNRAWTLSRYSLTRSQLEVQHHRVDDYLDRYRYYE